MLTKIASLVAGLGMLGFASGSAPDAGNGSCCAQEQCCCCCCDKCDECCADGCCADACCAGKARDE